MPKKTPSAWRIGINHLKRAKAIHLKKVQFLSGWYSKHTLSPVDDFQQTQVEKVKPTIQTLVVAAVLLDLVRIASHEEPIFFPPDPKCRSAPILSSHTLRGPPLV